ncbi:MAG: hypothetical protein Q8R11_03355 [bacterium]|nr:hypothetical protein [bacterium]
MVIVSIGLLFGALIQSVYPAIPLVFVGVGLLSIARRTAFLPTIAFFLGMFLDLVGGYPAGSHSLALLVLVGITTFLHVRIPHLRTQLLLDGFFIIGLPWIVQVILRQSFFPPHSLASISFLALFLLSAFLLQRLSFTERRV